MDTPHSDWTVLLIGGSSAVGKTAIAQILARHLGLSVLLVDDVRLALQQMTSREHLPQLHVFVTDAEEAQASPEQIRDGLITVGEALIPALKMIMAHHIVVTGVGPVIIEGDGILPQLAVSQDFHELKHFWGLRTTHEVRAVFLYEADEERLFENYVARGRGFEALTHDEQRRLVRASWLYGEWLRHQAHAYHLPLVAVRPYDTLLTRILSSIALGT